MIRHLTLPLCGRRVIADVTLARNELTARSGLEETDDPSIIMSRHNELLTLSLRDVAVRVGWKPCRAYGASTPR